MNGLRAVQKKGFDQWLTGTGYDIVCLQETKLQEEQLLLPDTEYHPYFNYAQKKGYSGTAVLSKKEPLSVTYGIGCELDTEGRCITCSFPSFSLVCCYTPNSQEGLARIAKRKVWDDAFRAHCKHLDQTKPVLICGDLNVAHQPIDLKNPGANEGHAGYSQEEREDFSMLLKEGFVDTFRYIHPDAKDMYTWWSYRFHAREKNAGWRIDYWLCSNRIAPLVKAHEIKSEVFGSDHCPIVLSIDI